ncbi:MAG: ATP-binding cassette domain-containing protein [Rhodospirillales bacterium]|nr:ATP-binding cassette domain-containing protein [Rhodospirillales bacterium]MBO6787002.1 ATP-binding cassette domain-containing protein [Rhodospirillales bacterium]
MSDKSGRAWLKPIMKPLMPIFREVIAMSAFVNLLALATPVFTMQVYDRVVGSGGLSTLWGLIVGMLLVVLFDLALKQARSRIMQTVALRVDVIVGRHLFDKLVSLPLHMLEGKPASYWQSLFRDVDVVRNTLSGASAILLCDLPFVLMFFVLIWVVAAPIAWVLVIILPLFMLVAWRSGSVMAQANAAERESTQSRDALIAELIQGRTTIKALALDRAMRPLWEETHANNIAQSMYRGTKTDFYTNCSQTLTMATTIFLTSVGAYQIIHQNLTMGALIATNMLSGRLLGPLNQLVGQWRAFNGFKQSVDRLGEVFSSLSDRQESEVQLDKPRGEIQVENLSFAYAEGNKPVVDSVTVNIHAGGVHALVGRNGSGKTTLLKMIQGLYTPTNGRVLLDGADIAQFTRAELATWMGYVPQETVLFAGTVRDNIVHRFPDASDDQIVEAATAAGVHHFIIDLPDGYASDIGEAGRCLSGGQRQRIAIARALLGDPAVLLLDEPSASLDRQAEQELRKTLVEIGKTRTVIIVTHSPILLAACDDLVALDKGKVALAGPSREILPKLFGQQPMQKGDAAPAAPEQAAQAPASQPGGAKTPPPRLRGTGDGAPKAAPESTPQPAPQAAGAPKPQQPPRVPPQPATPPAPQAAPAPKPAPPPAAGAPKPASAGGAAEAIAERARRKGGDGSTADPSVPASNMFKLDGDAKRLLDDPYADLIKGFEGDRNANRKDPADAGRPKDQKAQAD